MRTARLAAALVLSLAGLSPAAAQVPTDRTDVRVDVRALSGTLTPESPKLVVRANAVNTTPEPIRNLFANLRFGSPLRGRSAIAAGGSPARFGTQVAYGAVPAGELAPGGTADVEFDVPLAQLPFDTSRANGVYPLRIEVRSRFELVGAVDTYVVWWPSATAKLRIAMLWPLAERSHRALGSDFYDDDLASSVEDGRLNTLLRVGDATQVPLTWAVDPELLDAVHRMATAYSVNGSKGSRNAAARAWLDKARSALDGQTVLPLPYGDPDLTTTAAGSLANDANTAFRLGRELLRRDLGTEGSTSLAWPPGPALSPAVETLLAAQGVKGVVVPESALPLTETQNYTPTAQTPLPSTALGPMTALVADAQLNRWVGEDTGVEGSRLAVQRFLADTAMTAMERPSSVRDLVIAPPRTWEPVGRFASLLLAQTGAAPWLEPVGLGALLGAQPGGEARTRTPSAGGLLDPAHVSRVVTQRRSLQRVRGILTDPQNAPDDLTRLDDALLRAVSSRWGEDPSAGARLVNTIDTGVRDQVGRLRLIPAGVVTMTGRTGRVPLTFVNDFGQPVSIRIRLSSNGRLELDQSRYESRTGVEVSVPPGTSTHIIEGRATTGGLFNLKVDVLSKEGAALGPGTTVRVRSTAYGAVALAVTGVAFALLLVASATRLLRRRRPKGGHSQEPDREPVPV